MAVLIGILAALSLVGGVLLALGEQNVVWLVSGIVSFAILGGFSSMLGLLKEIRDNQKVIITHLKEGDYNTEQSGRGSTTQSTSSSSAARNHKTCPSCGEDNSSVAMYCHVCGARL